jgi:hypothetical protein
MAEILVGLILLVIGVAFCVAGYTLFRYVLILWGFLTGLHLGAALNSQIGGTGFLADALGWIIGIVVGLILAALAYFLYQWQVAYMAGLGGYVLGTGLLAALGITGGVLIVGGLIAAVILALAVLALKVPKLLIILFTSLGGASAALSGLRLLLGEVKLSELTNGLLGAVPRVGAIWWLAWLVLFVGGGAAQWLTTRRYSMAAVPPPLQRGGPSGSTPAPLP